MVIGSDERRAAFPLGLGAEMVVDPVPEQHLETTKQIDIMDVHAGEVIDDQTFNLAKDRM
ncbi:MAG: hypothetical protein M0P29_12490 [Sphaerochaetaceae bacterium]|jgi:hypothetical protein|nr:hypothetical protein [Sphaerochaetaceae bacterium]